MKLRWVLVLAALAIFCTGCTTGQKEADMPQLILRYADNQPEDYPTTQAAYYFAELVEQRTQGKIRIRIYANGELGDEASVLQQVQFGGIDLARISIGTLTDLYQDAKVLQLPYLYDGAEQMWRVLDGQIGQDFLDGTQQIGVVGLSWLDAGARSFYTREQVTCLEDLQGRLIRVQESGLMSRMVQLLGAEAIQIAYNDVYSALQTRRIDGAENNLPSYSAAGHFEAAPYMILDEHTRIPEMQIISIVALDRIAEIDGDYVDVIRQCAKESALYERELWVQTQEEAEAYIRKMGCVVTELSETEQEKFRQAVQPIYDECTPEQKLLVEKIRAA